jgi:hypothetical protein
MIDCRSTVFDEHEIQIEGNVRVIRKRVLIAKSRSISRDKEEGRI